MALSAEFHNATRRSVLQTVGRLSQGPLDDPVKNIILTPVFAGHASACRDAGLMNGFPVAGDEMVPPVEIASLVHQAVSTSRRQPIARDDTFRREADAILDDGFSVRIVAALAALAIEKAAGEVCVFDFPRVIVLEFQKAAEAASVAQAFPFGGVKLGERLMAPELSRRAVGSRSL